MKEILDFVIVGPQRTGSSWLDRALRTHPDIALPELSKETFFFDQNSPEKLENYFTRYFSKAAPEQCFGEVGPTYFHNPAARERLKVEFPDLKIIVLLRDPVDRAYSLFRHEVAKGRSVDNLSHAVSKNPEILESGRYATHIPKWQEDFGAQNVLVVPFTDLIEQPAYFMSKVYRFLKLNDRPLDKALFEKYGAGRVPKYQKLATVAAKTSRALRKMGLDRAVEFAKSLGLKPLIFGGGNTKKLNISPEQRAFLETVHANDIRFLTELHTVKGP